MPTQQRTLTADLDTPVSAFLKLRPLGAFFLLESVEKAGEIGRYSLVGIGKDREIQGQDPGEAEGLNAFLSSLNGNSSSEEFPFVGGAFGYLGFDFIHSLEELPRPAKEDDEFPLFHFIVPKHLVVFDHFLRRITILGAGDLDPIAQALTGPVPRLPKASNGKAVPLQARGSDAEFEKAVSRAKEFIYAGDIFQVVLSRRFSAKMKVDPFEVYRKLRALHPSPYSYFMDFGERQIVGASPEALVRLQGGEALTRPIAGTRPRGGNEAEDSELEADLLADEKECSEHLMLVDLARNDLSRVCNHGSVQTRPFMQVERFSHVMHLVSGVQGKLKEDKTSMDLVRAAFPAGTLSGAPKVRAMEILTELEGVGRGPYGGALGFFTPGGDVNLCITIRSLFFEKGRVIGQAGAGIVAHSDPAREREEVHNKMAAMEQALREAQEAGS